MRKNEHDELALQDRFMDEDIETYYADVFKAVFRNMVGKGCTEEQAEDYAAKAVHALHARIHEISSPKGGFSFAYRVADNAWKDYHRRKSTELEILWDPTKLHLLEGRSHEIIRLPEDILIQKEDKEYQQYLICQVDRAIDEILSEDEKLIINMYRDEVQVNDIVEYFNGRLDKKTVQNKISLIMKKIWAYLVRRGELD